MNRFRFRLESLLRFRGAKEEEKKRELGISLGHLSHEQAQLDTIVDNIDKHDGLMEESGKGKISVKNLVHNFFYARSLERKKSVQTEAMKKARTVVDSKRSNLVEATKERKIIERLKEKKKEEYNRAVVKSEQAIIDEAATQRFNHEGK